MKASRCAATILSPSLVLGALGLLASCSLQTTGSGDFSLTDQDDSSTDDAPATDEGDPVDGDGNVDGGSDIDGRDAAGVNADDDDQDADDADDEDRDDNCRPGNYEGSYVCKQPPITTPPWATGFGGSQINGTFTFRLTPTGKADSFELIGGKLHNEQFAFFKVDATITATLTCGRPLRGKLTDATVTGLLGTASPFESPFDATFDETTGSFQDGTWLVSDANGTACEGTWTATRSEDD